MLSQRETQILRAIINEYMHTAQPVGSRLLVTRYGLGISPATIRSVMAALTEAGFLRQPHTSAGRVPTEQAYRMYLENTEAAAPSVGEQEKIASRLSKAGSPEQASTVLAQQLAEISGSVGIQLDESGPRFTNLSNLFGHHEFADPRVAAYLAELLDHSPVWLPKFASRPNKLSVRIGQENEDFRARTVSVLGTLLKLKDYVTRIAVIGPTRMPYQKVISLFEFGGQELERRYA